MRIHLQNPIDDPLFHFSRTMWDEAVGRAGATGHSVTVGTGRDEFVAAMADADALVCDAGIVKAWFPCPAPHLKLLFLTNAGLDRLAPYDWLPPKVALMNNRGTHAAKAGEFGIMAVLMLANRIPAMTTNQRAGRWQKLWGSVLSGRRMTVVGLGVLGGAVAEHGRRFGLRVTGVRTSATSHPHCDRVVATTDLDAVLPETDFLVLACPLTEQTRGLLDRRRLGLLPHGTGLVNIGRGDLVDQNAVCDLLDDGHLSGAVLDVFSPEPIPAGHRLWTTPNLIVSPHTSADDPATYNAHSLAIFLDNLRAYQAGQTLPNLFDTARGY